MTDRVKVTCSECLGDASRTPPCLVCEGAGFLWQKAAATDPCPNTECVEGRVRVLEISPNIAMWAECRACGGRARLERGFRSANTGIGLGDDEDARIAALERELGAALAENAKLAKALAESDKEKARLQDALSRFAMRGEL